MLSFTGLMLRMKLAAVMLLGQVLVAVGVGFGLGM